MAIIKDLFTEKDGVSFCPVRAGFIIGFLLIVIFTIKDIANGETFLDHAKDWVTSLAEYLGLGGSAVAGKNFTEKE